MELPLGLVVRIRSAPRVDPSLWGRQGIVLGERDGLLLLELASGEDVAVRADQTDAQPRPPRL